MQEMFCEEAESFCNLTIVHTYCIGTIYLKNKSNFSQPNTYCDEKGLRHSVDYPGQLSSLSVVPVIIEELADGDDDQATEDATNYLQDYFSLS